MFKPEGLLTWYVVHLATGADHLYVIRSPEAGGCALYSYSDYQADGTSMYFHDWTRMVVDNYINDAYKLLHMQRTSDPNPSDDLLVLFFYWRRYYQNTVSFVMCTEIEQLLRF